MKFNFGIVRFPHTDKEKQKCDRNQRNNPETCSQQMKWIKLLLMCLNIHLCSPWVRYKSDKPAIWKTKLITYFKAWGEVKSLSRVQLFVTLWTVAYQAPPMGFSRQEYRSGKLLLQRSFPTQRWNPGLPHCRQTLYCLGHQGSLRPLK